MIAIAMLRQKIIKIGTRREHLKAEEYPRILPIRCHYRGAFVIKLRENS